MEVVAATPNGNGVPPFHNHDVHEWSRIDSLTGALERARLETDHWAANTHNSSHKYGKVVDSRARSDADGAVQQRARKQVEVFQSTVPGGHLQVIKSHTVSSSRWTSKTTSSSTTTTSSSSLNDHNDITHHFGDLELSLNPLDLTSQKSKATVGRSVGRRPPSRPRVRDDASFIGRQTYPLTNHTATATNLHRVSRLCHQIHENAVKQVFGKYHSFKPPIHERESGDGVEIIEIENLSNNEKPTNGHPSLTRTKSSSSEDLLTYENDKTNKSIEDLEDLEQLQSWRRTSKIRRSLQFPKQTRASAVVKPHDLPENTGSVRKIREDLETGRRLNTALRGNNVDLEALDQILQSISSSSSSDKNSTNDDNYEQVAQVKKQKRNSFVTVESLQEVKGRLRRTSSPSEDIYKVEKSKEEEADDGIVTEESNYKFEDNMPVGNGTTRVRSYVYGMEAMLNKKPMLGTGSLESRTSKQVNGATGYRNEDWYNRRKSYGFEQVHSHQEPISTISKNKIMESSTDSGICRSSEIVLGPPGNKSSVQLNKSSDYNSEMDSAKDDKRVGNVKRYTSIFEHKTENSPISSRNHNQINNSWNHRFGEDMPTNEFEGTTITIPITSRNFQKSANHNHHVEVKRHSIAVDESKYVTRNYDNNKYRRISLAVNDKFNDQDAFEDDPTAQGKKQKKVEFCKTEVHFAAESGRVNIVATDEKPPPTNNFRRRRRNSTTLYNQLLNDMNKNGLPVLHFGDSSYEKNLFGLADQEEESKYSNDPLYDENDLVNTNTVTVSTNQSYQNYLNGLDDELKEENEAPKGILKNKPIKPKPYLLGDDNFFNQSNNDNDDENAIWGVKLKPVQTKTETPMWRSTVTLKNTLYGRQPENNYASLDNVSSSTDNNKRPEEAAQPEFQKLLKTLRPTKKSEVEDYDGIRIIPTQVDPRRSSWSVADKVKLVEESQKETKVYSTKVNIGGGEATVIQDNLHENIARHPSWPRHDDLKDGKKQIINKGLVVRIGHDETKPHRITSNTTADNDSTSTTTTKITIDLSPSPTNKSLFQSVRLPRASLHNFKSTSLILDTFKNENQTIEAKSDIPQQLEALRKLYEDWQSDSEADKEVQSLMTTYGEERVNDFDVDNSSVVSGSWSKMRAFRNVQTLRVPEIKMKSSARVEKDFSNTRISQQKQESESISNKRSVNDRIWEKQPLTHRTPYSPVILRKTYAKKQELKTAHDNDKLSSPFLVGLNVDRNNYESKPKRATELSSSLRRKKEVNAISNPPRQKERSPTPTKELFKHYSPSRQKEIRSPTPPTKDTFRHYSPARVKKARSPSPVKVSPVRISPSRQYSPSRHKQPEESENRKSPSRSVLRNPRKSELAYFGVNTTPSPKSPRKIPLNSDKKVWTNKPDLLQHYDTKHSIQYRKSDMKRSDSPFYENIDEIKNYKPKRKEFDSSILDELTKAADQILQAVNGYGEDSQKSDDDCDDRKGNYTREKLDTISETKSWKQDRSSSNRKTSNSKNEFKPKLKQTSPTSSVESIAEQRKTSVTTVRRTTTTTDSDRAKKKVNAEQSSSRAATKARRLQRASSREALLQSHGSSSEDLPVSIEVPLRKPRLVRKTKATQLTVTNVVEVCKMPNSTSRRRAEKGKSEDRVPIGALPEIRHKTAISTIRSTAEKTASRLQRLKNEELKKKTTTRKECSRTSSVVKTSNIRSISSKDPINHRISTANIKKCNKSEPSTRQ